jgi:hypothetical protein
MEGGKNIVNKVEFKYRVKILNLLYKELSLTTNIVEQDEIEKLIEENIKKIFNN